MREWSRESRTVNFVSDSGPTCPSEATRRPCWYLVDIGRPRQLSRKLCGRVLKYLSKLYKSRIDIDNERQRKLWHYWLALVRKISNTLRGSSFRISLLTLWATKLFNTASVHLRSPKNIIRTTSKAVEFLHLAVRLKTSPLKYFRI